jgi:hypothetical protein
MESISNIGILTEFNSCQLNCSKPLPMLGRLGVLELFQTLLNYGYVIIKYSQI